MLHVTASALECFLLARLALTDCAEGNNHLMKMKMTMKMKMKTKTDIRRQVSKQFMSHIMTSSSTLPWSYFVVGSCDGVSLGACG